MEALQISLLQKMSAAQKIKLTSDLTHDCRMLTLAGIKQRNPNLDKKGLLRELAALCYGRDLALKAYPPDKK